MTHSVNIEARLDVRRVKSLRPLLASFFFLFLVTTPYTVTPVFFTSAEKPLNYQFSTRRTAVINFLAALQMEEGCFVDQLDSPRRSGFLTLLREGVEPLSILNALSAINEEAAISYVASCQGSNGAIYSTPDAEANEQAPEMWGVDDAVTTLSAMSALDRIDLNQMISWILATQRSDGGFNDEPGITDYAIWNTYSAVRVLVALGTSFNKPSVIESLLTYYNSDGGFSLSPGGTSTLRWTFYGVSALALLGGLGEINAEPTTNYVLEHYHTTDNSFDHNLLSTYSGIKTLKVLGTLNTVNSTGIGIFVLSCQSQWHGGFQARPEAGLHEAISNCRRAILSLSTLDMMSWLDEEFDVLEEPVWTGDDNTATPPTTPPTTTLPPPPSPEILVGFTIVLVAITTFVVVVVAPRSSKKKKKIRKRKR